jgi:hypothetical protein
MIFNKGDRVQDNYIGNVGTIKEAYRNGADVDFDNGTLLYSQWGYLEPEQPAVNTFVPLCRESNEEKANSLMRQLESNSKKEKL